MNHQSQNTSIKTSTILWMGLLLTLFWFGTLGYRHLTPSDEGRYAEIAREMFVSNDWITIRYNDYKYFEKPPLQAWMTALAFKLFGIGEWQARLWAGLTGFLSILAVGFTAGKLFGKRTGLLSAIVLASSPIWILGSHINSLDMGLSAFMSLSLCTLLLAQTSNNQSIGQAFWMLMCWIFMGLAVLSKGLIGIVLPGLVLVTYSLTTFDFKIWVRLHWIKGIILFLVITAPWFILISEKNPEFAHFFFIHEHFERFTTDEHRRSAPWYFFLPILLIGFLPWLFQLPKSIAIAFLDRSNSQSMFNPLWLCFIWAALIFVFFSISHSKLPGYVIPIFPALAILTGLSLDRLLFKFQNGNTTFLSDAGKVSTAWSLQIILYITLLGLGFFALPAIKTIGETYESTQYLVYSYWIAVALSVAFILCCVSWLLKNKNRVLSVFYFATGFVSLCLIAGVGHETVGGQLSGYEMAQVVKPLIQKDTPFYAVRILDHTLPFYLEKTMTMVEFTDELSFGAEQEPHKWIPTTQAFIDKWNGDTEPDALALMSQTTYKDLSDNYHLPMDIVVQDPTRVIVKKIPNKINPS